MLSVGGRAVQGVAGRATRGITSAETETALAQALACVKRGDLGQAEGLLRQALARDPDHPGVLLELARIAQRAGNHGAAADCLRKAIAVQPGNSTLQNELGVVLTRLGERQQAFAAFTRALEIRPDDPDAIANIGTLHLHESRLNEALAAYRRALAIDPLHMNAGINIEIALKNAVPSWHFPMMNDGPRNAAFEAAIRRVAPGRSVLDIGTGSGLLAMMAARAGARSVTACEAVPWIAAKAAEVIAANGLSERIKLIAKRSLELQIGADLSERAEVLVSEVFGSQVLNEMVLPTLAHARAQLLQPGAIVVPRAANVRAYLAAGKALEEYFFVDRAAGFTLAAFNEFSQPNMGLNVNQVPHDILSEDFEVFHFDLAKPPDQPEKRLIDVVATRPGRCFGVVQWLRLDLAEGVLYENRPSRDAGSDGWGHTLYRFSAPIELKAGDRVRLIARHNGRLLLISNFPGGA
jgi:type II protein arginine methyltransferase